MPTKTKEVQQDLVRSMQHWQQIEKRAVASTGAVIEKTRNPLVHLVMEIIQRDSQLHHRIQQFFIDSLEGRPVALSPEDMGEISGMVDNHLRIENEMVELVNATLQQVRGRKMLVQEYLLNFLVEDERKHASLLAALDKVKRGLYPYA